MSTSNKIVDYPSISIQIIKEMNLVRANPKCYIDKIKNLKRFFRENILYKPRQNPIKTTEGPAAFDAAIDFLEKQATVLAVTGDGGLNKACQVHIDDIGAAGTSSHVSSQGNVSLSDRIEQFVEWDGCCSETIDFGSSSAEEVIINLIVDDGIPERLNRNNLFNPSFRYVGVATGPHKEFKIGTVINYVSSIRKLGERSNDAKNLINEQLKKLKERKNNPNLEITELQKSDLDAPDNAVEVTVSHPVKKINGVEKTVTKKVYTLKNDPHTQHIVEIENA
jgi:uncharacterized protein YkwD